MLTGALVLIGLYGQSAKNLLIERPADRAFLSKLRSLNYSPEREPAMSHQNFISAMHNSEGHKGFLFKLARPSSEYLPNMSVRYNTALNSARICSLKHNILSCLSHRVTTPDH